MTHLPLQRRRQSISTTRVILCGLHHSGLHHVLQQSIVSAETLLRTPHRDSVLKTACPTPVLNLLLLDGGHSTSQDLQLPRGGGRGGGGGGGGEGEGVVDSHPYPQSQSLEVSLQLVLLLLTGGVLTEQLLLPDDQLLTDLLQLLLLLLLLQSPLTVQLILCKKQNMVKQL